MQAGTTVHVVDDDDAVRDSLQTLLEAHGLDVRAHGSAREFLAQADAPGRACLVLDLHLPVVGGLDLLAMMRARRIALPVIFITGRSDRETRERALRSGAVAFLEKPVREDTLLAAIEAAFGEERAPARGAEPVSAALPH